MADANVDPNDYQALNPAIPQTGGNVPDYPGPRDYDGPPGVRGPQHEVIPGRADPFPYGGGDAQRGYQSNQKGGQRG